MKIQGLSTQGVSTPLEIDFGGKYGKIDSLQYVLVELYSDEGHVGLGYTLAVLPGDVPLLRASIESLAEAVVGQDPLCIERIWQRMYQSLRYGTHSAGPAAISAVDVALWDLQGKILNQPVYKLLGGFRDSIPVYASYDLWEAVPPARLAENAAAFVCQGFDAIKIRSGGSTSPRREAERMEAVREAVGPDVRIMYDAIQYYNSYDAIAIGRALEPFGLYWFEDPVPEEDVEGCARVAAALDAPVASGESTALPQGHHLLMEKRAVDIVMVDLMRVGGITPWLKVAAEAEAHHLPVVSHMFPEVSAPLLAAIPNGLILEYIPWSFCLFADPPLIRDGVLYLSDKPGFGLTLSPDVDRWQIS